MTPGIHLIHKPVGPTSFSVVQSCAENIDTRRLPRRPRICHGGALDPFASGLLLILIEPATKLFDYLHDVPKIYEASIRWGLETDNDDPSGQIISTGDPSQLSRQQLEIVLADFTGWREQVPPATSNKRIEGERAYVKAHRGDRVTLPPSRVYLHEARWLEHHLPHESRLRISVRGGFYVRSLARELGRRLGCGAHLSQLRRTAIGPWLDPGPDKHVEIHGRQVMPWTHSREVTDAEARELLKGNTIAPESLIAPEWHLPDGFPEPGLVVRGFQSGRLCFLLSPINGRLGLLAALRGGL